MQLGFTALGFIRGSVSLRGTFEAIGECADTVEVSFQPPILSLGNSIHLRCGSLAMLFLRRVLHGDYIFALTWGPVPDCDWWYVRLIVTTSAQIWIAVVGSPHDDLVG